MSSRYSRRTQDAEAPESEFDELLGGRGRGRKSNRRKVKEEEIGHREIKPKFQEEHKRQVYNLVPKTENQATAIQYLKFKQMVVLFGSAGTGKTFLASIHAANRYLMGEIDKIVIIRPYEHVGRSIGLRPGTGNEKILPLVRTLVDDLILVLGESNVAYMIEHGKIVLEALEDVRGRSYSKSCVIVDESQNCDEKTMKALLTRLEEDSQLIFCGDGDQKDIKESSGLKWMIDIIDRVRMERPYLMTAEDINQAFTNIGMVSFTYNDIVRSGLTAFWVKAMEYYKD